MNSQITETFRTGKDNFPSERFFVAFFVRNKKLAAMQDYGLQYYYCVALKEESGRASRRNDMERWVVAAKQADFAAIGKEFR